MKQKVKRHMKRIVSMLKMLILVPVVLAIIIIEPWRE